MPRDITFLMLCTLLLCLKHSATSTNHSATPTELNVPPRLDRLRTSFESLPNNDDEAKFECMIKEFEHLLREPDGKNR
jgi:hypothetical protein